MTDYPNNYSLYRDLSSPVIVCHHTKEDSFISIPHLHSQYEIYYNIKGAQSFFINKTFYRCEPHTIFVIPNTHIHKVVVEKDIPYERCIININAEIISAIGSLPNMTFSRLSWLQGAGTKNSHKITLDDQTHQEFTSLIDDYIKEESSSSELTQLIRLLELLRFVEEKFNQQKDDPVPVCEPTTLSDKVIRFIEQDPTRQLSNTDIAKALFIHENYLCTKFKAETDMTINHYIILRKIAEAKKLLYQGASVKEACYGSGFQNYSNFIRTFKSREGYPPSQLTQLTTPL